MTSILPQPQSTEVFYPRSDGEPLAETSVHVDAIIYTEEIGMSDSPEGAE